MGNDITLTHAGQVNRRKTPVLTEVWNTYVYFNLPRHAWELREFIFLRLWFSPQTKERHVSQHHQIHFLRQDTNDEGVTYTVQFTNITQEEKTLRFLHKGDLILAWDTDSECNEELAYYFRIALEIFTSYVNTRKEHVERNIAIATGAIIGFLSAV